MAAFAGEFAAVTVGTLRFSKAFGGMVVAERGIVRSGPEASRGGDVALGAGVGGVDFVMTDKAIGHGREVGFGGALHWYVFAFRDAVVTARAGILASLQLGGGGGPRTEISFALDCRSDERRDATHRDVFGVVEFLYARGPGGGDVHLIVASGTRAFVRHQAVFRLRGCGGRRMAGLALRYLRQMILMGKGPLGRSRGGYRGHAQCQKQNGYGL